MKNKSDAIKMFLVPLVLLGAVMLFARSLLGADFGRVITWWLALLALGVMAYPVTGLIFGRFHDGGFIFSKAIGLGFAGMLMWYLSSLHIMKFSALHSVICAVICAVLGVFTACVTLSVQKRKPDSWYAKACGYQLTAGKLSAALISEVIFLLFFVLWCYLRAFKPEAYGTEKFMDYGFMAVMDRCDYMPPEDLWMAGENINYYYVGQYLATYMTKITGAGVEYGYNLMMMTLAAFGFSMPFSLANNIVRTFLRDRGLQRRGESAEKAAKRAAGLHPALSAALAPVTGTAAGLAVSFAGNMHYPLFRWLVPWAERRIGYDEADVDKFWFPNSTRYIGYNPDTSDKTIHEFPSYSFILGDLHAHVINLIFVLTVLAMLFAWLLYRKEKMDELRAGASGMKHTGMSMIAEAFHPMILLLGFFIGMFHTTNFWDFPIYFVVSGAIILFSNAVVYRFSMDTVKLTALQAVLVLLISKIVCLPFTISFDQISTEIRLNYYRTPVHQLAILWGLPILLILIFLWDRYTDAYRAGALPGYRYTPDGVRIRDSKEDRNKLFQFIESLQVSDLFIVTIGLCGIGLVLIPEWIYVKDIYEGAYKRANTMFKLTYQSYIMFGICTAYILMKLLVFARSYFQKAAGTVLALCFVLTLGYFVNGVNSWFGDVKDRSRYQGLDATAFLKKENAADAEAIAWMKENLTGRPVVLECWGSSYSFYERVSAMTGFPTVLGWQTHEWLWRSEASGRFPAVVDERRKDVLAIYYSQDEAEVRSLIEKYDIEYIYVGASERNISGNTTVYDIYKNIRESRNLREDVNEELLRSLGEVVFETEKGYSGPTYIIRVNQS